MKLDFTFKVFDSLDTTKKYRLMFSGGKDSHALLGAYVAWTRHSGKVLDLDVCFSDTLLETKDIYDLIHTTKKYCKSLGINFHTTTADINRRYWVIQFGLGYPVPDYKNRWCTKELKLKPGKSERINIVGRHTGESATRDGRLKTCGSSECGIDKLTNTVEPIANWSNCDVWDWLLECDGAHLYSGVFNKLQTVYATNEDEKSSSLRMGCFHCPVVSEKRIIKQIEDNVIPLFVLEVRNIIEELRRAPRILSKKECGKTLGAILVDFRIQLWNQLKVYLPQLLEYGWISLEEIFLVESLLAKRSYPPTYTQEWIEAQEPWAMTVEDFREFKKLQAQPRII